MARSRGAEIAAEIGSGAIFVEADVTSEQQMTAAVDGAREAFGDLRVLVNCAGIGSASRTVGKNNAPFDPPGRYGGGMQSILGRQHGPFELAIFADDLIDRVTIPRNRRAFS